VTKRMPATQSPMLRSIGNVKAFASERPFSVSRSRADRS